MTDTTAHDRLNDLTARLADSLRRLREADVRRLRADLALEQAIVTLAEHGAAMARARQEQADAISESYGLFIDAVTALLGVQALHTEELAALMQRVATLEQTVTGKRPAVQEGTDDDAA